MVCLLEICSVPQPENKTAAGGRGKSKSKFLFHFQSHKEDMPLPVSSNPEVSMSSKFLPLLQGLEAVDKSTTANSMAELLDSYQEKTNSKMVSSLPLPPHPFSQFPNHKLTFYYSPVQEYGSTKGAAG